MALIFMDSFGHYDTAHLSKKYASINGGSIVTGLDGKCLQFDAGFSMNIPNLDLPFNGPGLYAGSAVQQNSGLGHITFGGSASNTGGNAGFSVVVNTNGSLTVNCAGSSNTSASGVFRGGTRNYIELYLSQLAESVSATATVWLNGVQIVTVTTSGAAKWNGNCRNFGWSSDATSPPTLVGSFYVLDTTGSFDNTRRGNSIIGYVGPNGAGHETNWSPTGAASNWQCVSDNPPDDDTTYVSSSTVGQIDTYTLSALPVNITSLNGGLQVVGDAREDAVGSRQVTLGISNGSTDNFTSAPIALTTSYEFYTAQYSSNPFTGAAWALGDLTTLQVGADLTN